jgi:hypothetical protein
MGLSGRGKLWLGVSLVSFLTVIFSTISASFVYATGQLTQRSLTLSTSEISTSGNDSFSFYTATGGNVGSIEFLYCTTADLTCVTPSGLTTTSATLTAQSGTGGTGFTISAGTNGEPYITRTAASISASTQLSYTLSGITNTSTLGSFYVRITTYAAASLGGGSVDSGVVSASTANQIVLTGIMPESLIFCTGGTINTTGGIPDCSTASSGSISFNQEFSPTSASTASSQMAASTNGLYGYNITVTGTTLTSGSNTIPAMGTSALSQWGVSEFGLNLVANTTTSSTPAVGSSIAPSSNGTTFRGQPVSGYGTTDWWEYVPGASIADSYDGGAGPTNIQIYTVSYIANVGGSQVAGTYTTTLTYICTSTF